jgi:hypothetical protein
MIVCRRGSGERVPEGTTRNMRTFALWAFGVLAAAMFGGLLGDYLSPAGHGWF